MAQKVYRAALRSRCGTLRVHTAALGICLIRTDSMPSHEDNLALAREIHRDVLVGHSICAQPDRNLLFRSYRCCCGRMPCLFV